LAFAIQAGVFAAGRAIDEAARPSRQASAYRLYTLCQRNKRAPEALAYNALVQTWTEIMRLAHEFSVESEQQELRF
jgi:hypothetical protein